MRASNLSFLVFFSLAAVVASGSGCMTLHANLPEDAVRAHVAKEQDIELAAVCAYQGQRFTEGAIACMSEQRMSCGPAGRWVEEGDC